MSGYVDHGSRHDMGGTDPHERTYEIKIFRDVDDVTAGDEKFKWAVPAKFRVMSFHVYVTTVSTFGLMTVQLRNVTQAADILLTPATIDVGDLTSYTATTQPEVDPANQIVLQGDVLSIDVDGAGTGARGLGVIAHLK